MPYKKEKKKKKWLFPMGLRNQSETDGTDEPEPLGDHVLQCTVRVECECKSNCSYNKDCLSGDYMLT